MPLNLPMAAISAAMLSLLLGTPALAQQQNVGIRLPVVRQFNSTSSVMVPDGGTMSLGGISRSASGATSRGFSGLGRPFANRSIGRQTSRGQASVRAWVLSNQEINEAILSRASPARQAPLPYYKEVWARQQSARSSQQR